MKKYIFIIITFFLFPTIVSARSDTIDVTLNKCIDGDTASFIYNNETIKARFLAIDTPETKHPSKKEEPFGKEASDFTCTSLTNANKITLEFDSGSDEKDKYDRYLVWVFIDGKLLQSKLIEKGYAKVAYLYGDYKYTTELQEKENIAKTEKIGLWSNESNVEEKNSINDYIFFIIVIIIIIISIISYQKKQPKKRF